MTVLTQKKAHPLIEKIFIEKTNLLPSIKEYKKYIVCNDTNFDDFDFDKCKETDKIRREYNKYSFPILNHELFFTIKEIVNKYDIGEVSELMCGTGYFTYYLEKYDVLITDAIDNFSWRNGFKDNVMKFVLNEDAVKYVLERPEIELFIMAFPYADSAATTVWAAMQKNQYLLYIGEEGGGAHADDTFFKYIKNHVMKEETQLLQDNHIAFWGERNVPILLKK